VDSGLNENALMAFRLITKSGLKELKRLKEDLKEPNSKHAVKMKGSL